MLQSHHILMLLANGFRPDPRVQREARTLLAHGFKVTIVCMDRDGDLPPEQDDGGIRVIRVRPGRVKPGKAGSVGPALARFYRATLRLLPRLAAATPFSLIHCHDFDTTIPGLLLGKRLKVPVVYDVHDLYSSFFRKPQLERLVQRLDRAAYRAADATIVVNEGFFAIEGLERAKSCVVMNVPDKRGSEACPEREVGLFYAGNLEARRDMRFALPVIAAAGLRAVFAGDGPLLDAHRAEAPANVEFLGRIPHAQVVQHTRHCLAVLVLYDTSVHNNRLSTPNKLFDGMKFGKPAIVCEGSVAADIVRARDSGVVVRYGDPDSLAAGLEQLKDPERYATLSRNAFAAFHAEYHWELMEQRLVGLYQRLLGN
jgi:glycosyltransferase involved in cell wall biosynthesis